MISLLSLMDVSSQIKAYIFSVSMENRAVKLCYLSETQNNANQNLPQNNRLEALNFLQWQNKLPQMKNTGKLKPVHVMLTWLFVPYVCLCLCWLWSSMHALQKKKQVKMKSQNLNCSTHVIYRVIMAHDFKFNEDTAYHKHEHQNRNIRLKKILRFMSGGRHILILLMSAHKCYARICLSYICPPFFLILCKFSFPYCLWLYCLCLGPPRTNDERKGNTTTNRKGKKVCTISNKWVGQYSLDMLPICICPCGVVNICICLTPCIISFLTVKELLQTVLAPISKDPLELIWEEAYYLFPFAKNLWNFFFTILIYIVKIVYYNVWLLYSFSFNKIKKT